MDTLYKYIIRKMPCCFKVYFKLKLVLSSMEKDWNGQMNLIQEGEWSVKKLIFPRWPLNNIFISLSHTFQLHWRETEQAVHPILIAGQCTSSHPGACVLRDPISLMLFWLLQPFLDLISALAGARCSLSPSCQPQMISSSTAGCVPQSSVTPGALSFGGILSRSPPTVFLHHLLSQHSHFTLSQAGEIFCGLPRCSDVTRLRA